MGYTSTDLIERLKARVNVPTAQGLYDNPAFLALLTGEMQGRVVPFYMSQREDFFLSYIDYACDSLTYSYDLPKRAVGQKVSDVNWYMQAGPPPVQVDMTIISPNEINEFGYYFQGDKIWLSRSKSTGWIRVYYYRRPANLVELSAVGTITNIDTGTNEVTISATPATFTTSARYDFVGASIGFAALSDDNVCSSILSNVMTFASLPTGLAVGDYVCLQYEAPVAQIPIDAINYLVGAAAVRLLQGSNYQSAYQIAIAELTRIESDLKFMVTPRADRDSRKISNKPFSTYPTYSRRFGGRI